VNDSEDGYFRAGILRGQLAEFEQSAILEHFAAKTEAVLARINDGKEATVWLCSAIGGGYLAAKMYRARRFRAFRNDKSYSTPLAHWGKDKRAEKAMQKATSKGREMGQRQWVSREWRTLEVLHASGVSVPEPVARCEAGILMEFIGDEDGPAPRMHDVLAHERDRVDIATLRNWWDSLRADVVGMLRSDLVHGDLSAYNVLIAKGQPRIIDVPQAVDGRSPEGFELLVRDLTNLTRPLQQAGLAGVHDEATHLAIRLYEQYRRGRL
jgi:RIO kinase 1